MRRAQLYLDDHLWGALQIRARHEKTTVSELVRRAVRERYLGTQEQRIHIMQRFIASRKPSTGMDSTAGEVRSLRRGERLEKLEEQ